MHAVVSSKAIHTRTTRLTSTKYPSMWGIGEPVVGEVIPHTTPGDAWLVGPLPARPVLDQTLSQHVVPSCQTWLSGSRIITTYIQKEMVLV